ncbi:unnamed protein product [Leptosia nina]|uniref:Uncharacterized protein n=1 Tax=Leptosia nina TaxID=320188 RepID=A0AAV1JIW4_9NEOP
MRYTLLIFLSFIIFVYGQTINNIRLSDHTTYIVDLVQKTVDRAQKHNWSSLKVEDVVLDINEEVLNKTVRGTVTLKNGFVVSMQNLALIQHTVQQVWLYTRSTNLTNLELRSTMVMHGVTIGYELDGVFEDRKYHNTGTITYPTIQFQIALIKNLYTDELSSRVVPLLPRTTNRMQFLPQDEYGQILSYLYDWNSTFTSVSTWANDVFAPIALDLAKTEHPIPSFCYDCPGWKPNSTLHLKTNIEI